MEFAWCEAIAEDALISEPPSRHTQRRQHGDFPRRSTQHPERKSNQVRPAPKLEKMSSLSCPIGMVRSAPQRGHSRCIKGTQLRYTKQGDNTVLSKPPRKSCDHFISRRRDKQSLLGTATKPLAPRLIRQEIREAPLPPHTIPRCSSSTNRESPQ
jgi:hypothetical protein